MSHHLEARMNELLRALAVTQGSERKRIVDELRTLNREKVLGPRPGHDPAAWVPLPSFAWAHRGPSEGDVNSLLKLFLRIIVTSLAPRAMRGLEFCGLLKVDTEDGFELSFACPFDEPRALVDRVAGAGASEREQLFDDLTARELQLQLAAPVGVRVPVAFAFEPGVDAVRVGNQAIMANPERFLSPASCRSTSGFLGFVGATIVRDAMVTQPVMVYADIEAAMNQGLDEWFRWLYCSVERGISFDLNRVHVRRSEPEQYLYDYEG